MEDELDVADEDNPADEDRPDAVDEDQPDASAAAAAAVLSAFFALRFASAALCLSSFFLKRCPALSSHSGTNLFQCGPGHVDESML